MERRDWSIKALGELRRIDSLESFDKADALVKWFEIYLSDNLITDFDLELDDLVQLSELFYKNIKFLRNQKDIARDEIKRVNNTKKFLKH